MLELFDVSVPLGGKMLLDGVSFRLRPGALTALVGRNGSGKSTLLACVNGRRSYRGRISLKGRDLRKLPARERAKQLALLPQDLPAPHITGRELVAFGREPYLDLTGKLRETDLEAVEKALEKACALELADRYVDTLSGGERQRVYLAMILAQETALALLDEPTAHMDQAWEASFLELLTKLKGEGKTFLVVLHDLNTAVRYADDLIVLEEGKVLFAGSREDCLREEILENAFRLCRYTAREDRIFFAGP